MCIGWNVWIDDEFLFSPLLYSMGIRCDRTKEMASMEGVDKMSIWMWVLCIITFGILISAIVYSVYMAIWGVYDEFY